MFKKKTILSLFLVICLSLTASVLFACEGTSTLEIKFLTPKYQYRVGDNIDVFELIERQKNVKYQFKVTSLEGETVDEFAGRTFCVSTAGIYTLTCTATLGEQTLTDSVEVNVYDRKPYMNVSSGGLVLQPLTLSFPNKKKLIPKSHCLKLSKKLHILTRYSTPTEA